jgi:hypothetical protein
MIEEAIALAGGLQYALNKSRWGEYKRNGIIAR